MDRRSGDREISRLTTTLALVVLVAAGCGGTPAPSASEAPPPETPATTEATTPVIAAPVQATTAPLQATTAPVQATTAPVPKATTSVLTTPSPRPSNPVRVPGADPAIWASTFCGGVHDVIAAASAISEWPPTPQDTQNDILYFLDTAQQAFTNTVHKLTQLGPPGTTGGEQAQKDAVGFLTDLAKKMGDQRAQLAALDANDPDFAQKLSQIFSLGPDVDTQLQLPEVINDQKLELAVLAVPECQRLPR